MPDTTGITSVTMSTGHGEPVTIDIDDLDRGISLIDRATEILERRTDPGSLVGEITIDGEKLCQAINAITPHVGSEDLAWIRITIASDVQVLATDRYSAAIARIDSDAIFDTDHDVWHFDIHVDDAKLIAAIFKPNKDDQASIRLRATTTDLTVTDVSGLVSGRELTVEATNAGESLDGVQRLVAKTVKNLEQSVITTASAALWVTGAHQWSKFVKSAACFKPDPLHIESHEPGKAFLITIGKHFIGLLATRHSTSTDLIDEHRDTVLDWLDLLPAADTSAAA